MDLKPKKIAMTTHCPRRVVATSLIAGFLFQHW